MKKCGKCYTPKELTEFCKRSCEKDGLHRYCKECKKKDSKGEYNKDKEKHLKRTKKYQEDNRNYFRQKSKDHYHNNKEYYRKWNQNKSANDPVFRLKHSINSNININLKKYLQTKTDLSMNYLGITLSEYVQYMEKQFDENMNWDNYGSYWEIDHIKPIDSFDLTDEKQIYECFNYLNTRPLYWKHNKEKSNKIL